VIGGRSDDAVTARLGVVTKLYPNTSYLDVTVPSERATVTLVGMEDVEFITGAGTLAEDIKIKRLKRIKVREQRLTNSE